MNTYLAPKFVDFSSTGLVTELKHVHVSSAQQTNVWVTGTEEKKAEPSEGQLKEKAGGHSQRSLALLSLGTASVHFMCPVEPRNMRGEWGVSWNL